MCQNSLLASIISVMIISTNNVFLFVEFIFHMVLSSFLFRSVELLPSCFLDALTIRIYSTPWS